MQQNLRQLIDEIISAVTQLSSAVEEMTQISNQSADGMKEQQYQITQVATAMTQMKAAVADVARNTEDSASQAMAANHKSQEGLVKMLLWFARSNKWPILSERRVKP